MLVIVGQPELFISASTLGFAVLLCGLFVSSAPHFVTYMIKKSQILD